MLERARGVPMPDLTLATGRREHAETSASRNDLSARDVTNAEKKFSKEKRREMRPVFEGIRKPLAPPGYPTSHAKPEEKARPSGTAKHKHKPEISDSDSAD